MEPVIHLLSLTDTLPVLSLVMALLLFGTVAYCVSEARIHFSRSKPKAAYALLALLGPLLVLVLFALWMISPPDS